MRVRWQCESDPWCRGVLARHWPGVPCYPEIRTLDDAAERVNLLCGGFPCQPVSLAGKGKAQADPRWLWPEFARVIALLRPRYVLVENVPGLRRRGLCDVLGDLAALRFDAEWQIVSAASLGAPHLRERLFVVAWDTAASDSISSQLRLEPGRRRGESRPDQALAGVDGAARALADTDSPLSLSTDGSGDSIWAGAASLESRRRRSLLGGAWDAEPAVGRVANGVPERVARLRGLGNAVVPQVAEAVGRMIVEADRLRA